MQFERHISRRLHEEHQAHLDLLARFEQIVARARDAPPADDAWAALARALATGLEQETAHHFEFEERELFPRLAAAGEADIGQLLTEEHETIREVAGPLPAQLRASVAAGFDAQAWRALRAAGLELAERMQAHIQKEEMALLPAVEDLLDEEADRELAAAYCG
ncbi:MAG: hemerythrin domain-containing protein [Proteobacteria bacterium]|nr:hemerythrin domain-containing protein [Pseudomonadota bacterium]